MMAESIETEWVACPLCGATESRQVCSSRDFVYGVSGEFRFVRCTGCGHIFMNPRPTEGALLLCYPLDYCPHGGSAGEPLPQQPQTPEPVPDIALTTMTVGGLRRWIGTVTGLRRLLCWLGDERATILPCPPHPGASRMLEIGCAHGGYLASAARAGWVIDGIEPSGPAAERARARGIPVFAGRLDQAPLEPGSREAVISWMVLEHVADPVRFLESVYATLAPGGLFAFSIPNSDSLERWVFGRYWQGYDPPRHLQIFSAAEIQRLLIRLGFADVRVIYQAGIRDTYAGAAAWGMDRFPRSRWPQWLMSVFRGDPPAWLRWPALLPARLVAWLRLSSRITVVARRPVAEDS